MNLITILEEKIREENQKRWYPYLLVQKALVEKYFDWLNIWIDPKERSLKGRGKLKIGDKSYSVRILFSPFYPFRYDRIYIEDSSIKYSNDVHLYRNDLSLCLYHPIIDQPLLIRIPLFKMIPWVSEWIIFYEQWKKYGVWLGKEIKHY